MNVLLVFDLFVYSFIRIIVWIEKSTDRVVSFHVSRLAVPACDRGCCLMSGCIAIPARPGVFIGAHFMWAVCTVVGVF